MRDSYEKPRLTELGALQDLTEQQFNKIGAAADHLATAHRQCQGQRPGRSFTGRWMVALTDRMPEGGYEGDVLSRASASPGIVRPSHVSAWTCED